MLDRECIQARGFKNVVKDGKAVGFQVNIRSLYYRGVYLSQLRPATVIVDGVEYGPDKITWTINGKTYTHDEMKSIGDVHWDLLDPATLTVSKPGGLAQGAHDIEVKYSYSASYLPPDMDEQMGRSRVHQRRLVLV